MGKVILVGGEKGGTSKTTTAVNLAAMAALAGHQVLLMDTDRQESASIWAATRAEQRADQGMAPDVTCVAKTGKIGFDVVQLKDKFDFIIVDAGGRDSVELRQAMAVCDLMVIPLRPSQFDSWSMNNLSKILREIEEKTERHVDARALFSLCSPNPSVKEVEEGRAFLSENYPGEFKVMSSVVCERVAFRRAARDGLAVIEVAGSAADPKASQEMQAVYKEVFNEKWKARAA